MVRSITIRRAAIDEYPAGIGLREAMAREMGSHDFESATADWRAGFIAYFAQKQRDGDGQWFLAYDGERAIGSTIIYVVDDYRRVALGIATAYVHAVYVMPDYRGGGVAKRLMEAAIAWAREKRCRRVRLRSSDAGRPLYEALHFHPTTEMELSL